MATSSSGFGGSFSGEVAHAGVTIPTILQQLLLAPCGSGLSGDYFYCNNQIEGIPIRGGNWTDTSYAGVFEAYWGNGRAFASSDIGFRPAFCS